jgi:hypothetical protein
MAIKLKKDAFVKNLIKGHKLAPHIDAAIGQGEFKWSATFEPKHGDDAWHPSGDCVPSPAALYERAVSTSTSTKPSISLLKTFTVGHFWHHYIQHIVVERLGFANWLEVENTHERIWGSEGTDDDGHVIPKPFQWARGSADIAPCHIPIHGDYLVDIKTMGSHDFKQNGLPSWCAPKYECQMNIYMDWFDLEKCLVLCVSKDSPHDLKEFEFDRNQPLIDAIYSKWKLVGDCVEIGLEPPLDYEVPLPLVGPKM